MHEIKGEYDHALRFRQNIGNGTYGKCDFSITINVDGRCLFIEFKERPSVKFSTQDMVSYAYEMLEQDGYVKNGKNTTKDYDFIEHLKRKREVRDETHKRR